MRRKIFFCETKLAPIVRVSGDFIFLPPSFLLASAGFPFDMIFNNSFSPLSRFPLCFPPFFALIFYPLCSSAFHRFWRGKNSPKKRKKDQKNETENQKKQTKKKKKSLNFLVVSILLTMWKTVCLSSSSSS